MILVYKLQKKYELEKIVLKYKKLIKLLENENEKIIDELNQLKKSMMKFGNCKTYETQKNEVNDL